jgi:hypothetical protein
MKKLIMAGALTAVLVWPALAQSYDPDLGSGNVTRSFRGYGGAYHAFARARHHEFRRLRAHRAWRRHGAAEPSPAILTAPSMFS